MTPTTVAPNAAPSPKAWSIGLWVPQVLLAVAFGLSGTMKLVTPLDQLVDKMPWVAQVGVFVRFIGLSEVAGALGLILPGVTRIKPGLTALAALGLVVIMVLAAGLHASQGEWGVLPVNFVLGGLAAFVAWGRARKAPFAPRSQA